MQRPTFVSVPVVRVIALSLPPMYAWPTPLKRATFGLCVVFCISAYMAMAAGIISLATLALKFL
jgi:prepilin signal peptidase PulO-like enzyme (type II secretory pathway)